MVRLMSKRAILYKELGVTTSNSQPRPRRRDDSDEDWQPPEKAIETRTRGSTRRPSKRGREEEEEEEEEHDDDDDDDDNDDEEEEAVKRSNKRPRHDKGEKRAVDSDNNGDEEGENSDNAGNDEESEEGDDRTRSLRLQMMTDQTRKVKAKRRGVPRRTHTGLKDSELASWFAKDPSAKDTFLATLGMLTDRFVK